jgi:aldehyde:ferredoxin oxidoreductase
MRDAVDRASGRGGTGCVGGSKNLKAVVVKAEKKIGVNARVKFISMLKK